MAEKKIFPKEKKKEKDGLKAGVVGKVFRFVAKKILETRAKDKKKTSAFGVGSAQKEEIKSRKKKGEKVGLAEGLNRGEDIRSIEEQLFGDEKKKNKK